MTTDRNIRKGYENLANAIITFAVKDYVRALKKLAKDPEDIEANYMKVDCERFFNSDLFMGLTNVSPEYVIAKAKEAAIKHEKRGRRRYITRCTYNP